MLSLFIQAGLLVIESASCYMVCSGGCVKFYDKGE